MCQECLDQESTKIWVEGSEEHLGKALPHIRRLMQLAVNISDEHDGGPTGVHAFVRIMHAWTVLENGHRWAKAVIESDYNHDLAQAIYTVNPVQELQDELFRVSRDMLRRQVPVLEAIGAPDDFVDFLVKMLPFADLQVEEVKQEDDEEPWK